MEANIMMCPDCFSNINSGTTICPRCGFSIGDYHQREAALPLFTKLHDGQYLMGRVIGQGGFGITYKAYDTFQNKIVAIKEYMPSDYAERRGVTVSPLENAKANKIFEYGKSSYIDEIKTLYQFTDIDGIVDIYNHFQENNTAYLIMEFLEGCSLKEFVRNNGGKIDISTARNYIYDVAKALNEVHKAHVLHRDISPENIYLINKNRTVKLIDFGAARSYVETSETEKSVLLKPGFAPPEQYSRTGNQGTWTDIYALAATLYYIVSGKFAPDSMSRMKSDTLEPLCNIVPGVSQSMSNAVMEAMELDYNRRTRTCQQFMDNLDKTGWTTHIDIPSGGGVPVNPPVKTPPVKTFIKPTPPKRQTLCRITCVSGEFVGKTITFYPGQVIRVGRKMENCDFIVSGEQIVSKEHCRISFDAATNRFFVTDVSANGTYTQRGTRLPKNVQQAFPPGSIVYLARPHIIIELSIVR